MKSFNIRVVALCIAFELSPPVVSPGPRYSASWATWVLMPEASMDKDGFFPRRERNVRLSRQRPIILPESIAHPMKQRTHTPFGCGILTPYCSHLTSTRLWNVEKYVLHGSCLSRISVCQSTIAAPWHRVADWEDIEGRKTPLSICDVVIPWIAASRRRLSTIQDQLRGTGRCQLQA